MSTNENEIGQKSELDITTQAETTTTGTAEPTPATPIPLTEIVAANDDVVDEAAAPVEIPQQIPDEFKPFWESLNSQIGSLRIRVAEVEEKNLQLEMALTKIANFDQKMADQLNRLVAWVKNLPTNREVLFLLAKNCIEMYNAVEDGLQLGGFFNYELKFTDEPIGSSTLLLEIGVQPEEGQPIPRTIKRDDGAGGWIEIADDDKAMEEFHNWLRDQALAAGYKQGSSVFVTVDDKTTPEVVAGVDGQVAITTATAGMQSTPTDEDLGDVDG